jgi:co-chaperonin GroES (HSP10)
VSNLLKFTRTPSAISFRLPDPRIILGNINNFDKDSIFVGMTPKKLHCPVKNLLVTLENKHNDSVTFASGQVLYFDPTWHPEEYAMMEATIVSVPDKVGRWRPSQQGWIEDDSLRGVEIDDMRPGDKALIRYDVVHNYIDQPDRDSPRYKNLFLHEGQEYWKCSITQVFAYIRDEVIHMVNGWVICDILEETKESSSLLILPDNYKTVTHKDKMRVRHIGKTTLPIATGDIVFVDPQYVQTYKINLDEFYIIRQSRIIAKAS